MIKFKKDLNEELSHINCSVSSTQIIARSKPTRKPSAYIPRLVAAVVVLVLLAGICFAPSLFGTRNQGFVIYAGAEELNNKYFVDLDSNDPNYIKFNFNYILDETAEPTDITKKYLFHSFEKKLNLNVIGENIDNITYKINTGSLSAYSITATENGGSVTHIKNTFSENNTQFTIGYHEQNNWTFSFSPSCPKDDFYHNATHYIALANTGEITTIDKLVILDDNNKLIGVSDYSPIAYGYKDESSPIATEEEIEKLREYIYADDMLGFYNYQNEVFKRIIDETTLDIIITKIDGTEDTKTIQLCYTPTEVTSSEMTNDNHCYTLSNGTLSAKLIEN